MSTKILNNYIEIDKKRIFQIANRFVELFNNDNSYISSRMLQCFCYYIQGVCLVDTGEVEFEEDIIATKFTPIIRSIREKYKSNRADNIIAEDIIYDKIDTTTLERIKETYTKFYGGTNYKIRMMACLPSPNNKALAEGKDNIISRIELKDYFTKILESNEVTETMRQKISDNIISRNKIAFEILKNN